MLKKTKIFLLIYSLLIGFFLFPQLIYAGGLHFIAYGDTRQNIQTMEKPQRKHDAIAKVISQMEPDFVLFSGDMIYYNEFDRFLEIIARNYAGEKMIPLYPAIGNHEIIVTEKVDSLIREIMEIIQKEEIHLSAATMENMLTASKLKDLWLKLSEEIASMKESQIKTRSHQVLHKEFKDRLDPAYTSYLNEVLDDGANGRSWYSFLRKVNGLNIKFIVLNSLLPDDEEQLQWFLEELKHFGGPKVVLQHYPPYSIGNYGYKSLTDKQSWEYRFRERYTRFFNDVSNNIVLIMSGHDHNYQRIGRVDESGNVQIPVYVITGGGGADLSGTGEYNISEISFDGFRCMEFSTAYHFLDIIADTDDKNNILLECKVFGLRYDITKGLPCDDTFVREFEKDHLELIDQFMIRCQK
ncbi:MAG: metallophosphoesterase family protein [Candidatus Loosdrechtia sp.]|uniref:metallophosphoesterase family protein n=1 Tax=Candidatus Loosdrechtia sp. TaxID=3101272 RepID=UPI003A6E663F|nr:MAG: metallophosphoesterase [Candidatus Jettenia sp. AMX2]